MFLDLKIFLVLSTFLFLKLSEAVTEFDDDLTEIGGFYLDVSSHHEQEERIYDVSDPNGAVRPEELECPTTNVITTRYRCKIKEHWTDCTRSTCCPGFTYVAGRCIPDDINPCSLNLCEQKCSVYFGRVICTCFVGYKFNAELHKQSSTLEDQTEETKACQDVDECAENNGDCQQLCVNTVGSHKCACRDGFILHLDNQTCIAQNLEAFKETNQETIQISESAGGVCNANCHTVTKLKKTVDELTEKVRSLATAIKLYSFAAGPPGPPGPPGPVGPPGPRGFPGMGTLASAIGQTDFGENNQNANDDDDDDDVEDQPDSFDSFKIVKRKGKKHFCKCKRGPMGHPGAPGIEGPRGPKGEPGLRGEKGSTGSFDFLMLMVSEFVFPGKEKLPRYNLQQQLAWENRAGDSDQAFGAAEEGRKVKYRNNNLGRQSGISPNVDN